MAGGRACGVVGRAPAAGIGGGAPRAGGGAGAAGGGARAAALFPPPRRADPSIGRGRRREHSRHRSSGGSGLPGWVAWTLRSGMPLISLLPALIAVVLVQSLNPAAQRVPTGEGRFTVGGSWAAAQPGAIVGYQHWTTTPVIGWLQLGALEKALLGGTAQSVLASVHGAMLLVALATVVLLWFVLRRVGASGLAAGAATAVFGIAPIAVVVHT